jgi:hypothetical protein
MQRVSQYCGSNISVLFLSFLAAALPKPDAETWVSASGPECVKNSFLSCVLQPIAGGRGDFPTIYQDQRR